MNTRTRYEGLGMVVSSMFVVWWALLVMAIVTDYETLWSLTKWSPCILIPWGVLDIWRHNRR